MRYMDQRRLKRILHIICPLMFLGCVCAVIRHFKLEKLNNLTLTDLVNTFTSQCLHRGIPIFVIEPVVLRSWLAISESKLPCVLCSAGNVLSLGVFEADWEKRGSLLPDLNDHYIILNEVTSPDPRLLSLERLSVPSIPTHYLIHQLGNVRPLIHLVVFYKRADNFLWHSSLEPSSTTVSNLTFGKSAGAYDRGIFVDGMWLHIPHTVEHYLVQISKAEFIECDYQGAQKYLRHNHQANSTMTQYGTQVLLQVTKVLDDLGIQFWLSCGTCLGWYRQCGFIAHTTDIDIEIPIQEYSASIIPAFLKAGFKLVLVTGKPSDSYTFAVVAHIKVDVFFVYEAKTYQWYGATQPKSGRKFKYILPKFEVCWTHFMGIRVRVPCPALPYIIATYGRNWNTTVKRWDWTSSGKNVKKNGVWPKEEWDSVIQVYHLM